MKTQFLSACLLLLVLLACEKEEIPPSFSYLALGDSYTIGQSVEEDQRWPIQLAEALTSGGTSVRPPVVIARTGWTTRALINAIEGDNNLGAQYDMVSLLIGVNNQFGGRSIITFGIEFELLLQKSIALAGDRPERVFVLSIPDYGATLFGRNRATQISEEIAAFNAVIETVCSNYDVQFFNITPISQEVASDPDLLSSDGLHPSGKMYAQWVDLILSDVQELLSN